LLKVKIVRIQKTTVRHSLGQQKRQPKQWLGKGEQGDVSQAQQSNHNAKRQKANE
jgi:hypothetical protein